MGKWEKIRLADICDVITKGTTPTTIGFEYMPTGINFVKVESISLSGSFVESKFEHIDSSCNEKLKRSQLKKNDILFSIAGALGRTAIVTEDILPANTNQALSIIRLKDYSAVHAFIYYVLKSKSILYQLHEKKQGVAQLNLSLKNIGDLIIPLPPLHEQRRIAQTLDAAAGLLRLRKQQLAELDALVKSRFIEMFGDPVTNPKGWTVEKLSEHLKVIGGYAFKSEGFLDSGIPVLRIGNINSGKFKSDNMVFWNMDERLERYMIRSGDLVISLTGTVGKEDYANVCVLGDEYDCYYLNQRNAKLELYNTLDKAYLKCLMEVPMIKSRLTGISRGVRQANISNSDILNLLIPIPPLSLQTQFADFVHKVEASKALVQQSIDETQALFDSLMSEFFE